MRFPSPSTGSPPQSAVRGALVVLRSPVVWILFLAGLFDGISDNWVHAVVLWAAAILVGRDAERGARGIVLPPAIALFAARDTWPTGLRVLLAAIAVAYAAIVGSFTRYTWPDTVAVVLPGVLVLLVAWRGPLWPRRVPPRPTRLGPALWASVFVAAALWELTALLMQPSLQQGSYSHPTISYLMEFVLADWVGRAVVLLVWLGLGAFLLTRCTSEDPAAAGAQPDEGSR